MSFYRDIQPEDLPLPDHQVMRLIRYCSRDEIEVDELCSLVAANPLLTARILRLVNTPVFGFQQKIESIGRAVVALGLDAVRSTILCFAVREVLADRSIEGLDVDEFWEDAVRRAVAARLISTAVEGPVDEAFTAGMFMDVGLMIAFLLEPGKSDRWPLLRANDPQARRRMEAELFGDTHDVIGAGLARRWELEPVYVDAIEGHHDCASPTLLARILEVSDWCAALFTCHDRAGIMDAIKVRAAGLNLDADTLDALLTRLPEDVAAASGALEIDVPEQAAFEMLMADANRQLVADNLSYQELTWRLQQSLRERDEFASKLEDELAVAREIQQGLQPDTAGLTGVAAFNLPARHLSGDFYDYFQLSDGTVCFCLGDVSGKGTHAALTMAKTASLFRCLCRVDPDRSEVLRVMNAEISETSLRGTFVTFVAGWIDPSGSVLSLVNAGHLPPFLLSPGGVEQIAAHGPPLGIVDSSTYEVQEFPFPASTLWLYTDGLSEARCGSGEELGAKGLLGWLLRSRDLAPAEQAARIRLRIDAEIAERSDDQTMMIVSGMR